MYHDMNGLELLADVVCSHDYSTCQGRCIVMCSHCECFAMPCPCPCECGEDICDCICYCECTCTDHIDCGGYCQKSGRCILSLCDNFFLCKGKIPEHAKNTLGGTCVWCKLNAGRVKDSCTIELCNICLETVKTLILPCGHRMCYKCHVEWRYRNETCPFCRSQI
jgi:hypothetical protein